VSKISQKKTYFCFCFCSAICAQAAHIPQNGVSIADAGGDVVCFYGIPPSGNSNGYLYCFHTVTEEWISAECTTPHAAGSIVAMGPKVLIAGGP
jgi:hypothetical protein